MQEASLDFSGLDPNQVAIADLDTQGHAIFAQWRSRRPFLRRQDGVYLILRADDIISLSSDTRTLQIETELMQRRGVDSGEIYDFIKNSMLFSNGETHASRRAPLTRNFSFRMIEAMRPQIAALTDQMVLELCQRDSFEFMEEFSSRLPAVAIASLLDLPQQDIPYFTKLVYSMSRCLSPSWKPEELDDMEQAARDLRLYVQAHLDARRANPGDDFLSSYVKALDESGSLSALEEVIQLVLLILAGSDTTRLAMTATTGLLLERPPVWASLQQDATLIPAAVEEGLRFEPPVGSYPRKTIADIELDGHLIPAGSLLAMVTMSAMRDEKHFENPGIFDIHRQQMRWHMVFGAGAHRCLGEALARVELQEGIAALVRHAPHLSILGEGPRVHGHGGIRRGTGMQVRA